MRLVKSAIKDKDIAGRAHKEIEGIGDSEILVQYISRVRCTVQASCIYNVGGLKDVVSVREPSDEKRLDKAVRNWLSLGKNDVPR